MHAFFKNDILVCAMFSWCAAQLIKVLIHWRVMHRLDWRRLFGMGGMPSSHTAFFVSVAFMVAQREGLSSTAFAIAFSIAAVVIYDAMGVRYQTGRQSKVLNSILRELLKGGTKLTDEKMQELVGHTPLEVLFGGMIGIITPIIYTFK